MRPTKLIGNGGTARKASRAVLFVGSATLLIAAILVASASAARHPAEGAFGSAAQPAFEANQSVAVDAEGNLLVVDRGSLSLKRYKPDGTPADFSALGTNVIDGKTGPDETPQAGIIGTVLQTNEAQVAVDTSGGATNGDIYVTDSPAHVVSIFASTGAYIGQFTEFGGESLGETCGVTVDENGVVYLGDYNHGIHKYEPTSNPPKNADYVATLEPFARPEPTAPEYTVTLAAGTGATAGYLFVSNYSENRVAKIDDTTGALQYFLSEETSSTPSLPAVDPTDGHVYFSQGTTLREVDASSTIEPARISSITAPAVIGGVTANESAQVYVSVPDEHAVFVYGPLAPPTPFIESQGVVSVGAFDATVEAAINPEGAGTEYKVEYGPTESYGSTTPPLSLPGDETSHSVQVHLEGLSPTTSYHFHFVATNSVGTSEGDDRTFHTNAAGPSGESCPNEALRIGPSKGLPSCRAYELVSPVDKAGLNIEGNVTIGNYRAVLDQASTSGDALTYSTSQGIGAPEGVPYASQYLASRSVSGWVNQPLAAPQNRSRYAAAQRGDLEFRLFSPDLCVGALLNWSEPALAQPATNEGPNIYARNMCGQPQLAGVSASPNNRSEPQVGGISGTGDCIAYYYGLGDLNQSKSEGFNVPGGVYERCGSGEQRVDILPSGEPTAGYSSVGAYVEGTPPEQTLREGVMKNAVSGDGSTLYWTDSATSGDAGAGQLFVRINAREPQSEIGPGNECKEATKACTIPVSAEVEPASGASVFAAASADGTRAYYFIRGISSLYEFNLATKSSRLIATGLPTNSERVSPVLGASENGSRVYFFSENVIGGEGASGRLNLFLFESSSPSGGTTRLVATLPKSDASTPFQPGPLGPAYFKSARVSPDGGHAVFTSGKSLTGYDNRSVANNQPAVEVYRYDATANEGAGKLTCISCNPTGRRPESRFVPRLQEGAGVLSAEPYAALVPGSYTTFQGAHALTKDGSRVFFESYDALVPRDTNGKGDVYEWAEPGVPGCSTASASYSPANEGCVSLISTGQSPVDSHLVDATEDGRDVFFSTAQSLVSQDPGLVDIYDARIGGGFPVAPSSPAGCEGEACRTAAQAPVAEQPGTSRFSGPKNHHAKSRKCARGKNAKKKGCAKKAHHKRRHHQKRACHKGGCKAQHAGGRTNHSDKAAHHGSKGNGK